MPRAAIYARFSSDAQREESIEGQLRECRKYAKDHDMTVVREYADRALSGRTDRRPQFLQMIRDGERGKFDVIILWKMDRFARNRYDSATYKAKLKKAGVTLHYAKEHIPESPEGIILESVLEGMAEYFSANLSQNVARGLMENALNCKTTGGIAPLGYVKSPDGHYLIDPEGANIVRLIYEMYADGKGKKQICDHLNELGVKTAVGTPWRVNGLSWILHNRKYRGEYVYHDIVIPDGVPRIVSDELFERVQQVMKSRTRTKGNPCKSPERYVLTSKVFCGCCGAPMIGESGVSHTGTVYRYYKCAARKSDPKACSKRNERKDWLEKTIVRETITHALTPENIAAIADRAVQLLAEDAQNNSIAESLKEQLKEVNTSLNNLLKALEAGIFNELTQSRMEELGRLKKELEEKIEREQAAKPILERSEIIYWLESFRNIDIEDEDDRRRVIEALLHSAYVYDDDNGGKTRKIVLTYNLTENNTSEHVGSDNEGEGVRKPRISARFFCVSMLSLTQ